MLTYKKKNEKLKKKISKKNFKKKFSKKKGQIHEPAPVGGLGRGSYVEDRGSGRCRLYNRSVTYEWVGAHRCHS